MSVYKGAGCLKDIWECVADDDESFFLSPLRIPYSQCLTDFPVMTSCCWSDTPINVMVSYLILSVSSSKAQ